MGMQLMEINVTFSKKLNLLHNPGSKIRTKKKVESKNQVNRLTGVTLLH